LEFSNSGDPHKHLMPNYCGLSTFPFPFPFLFFKNTFVFILLVLLISPLYSHSYFSSCDFVLFLFVLYILFYRPSMILTTRVLDSCSSIFIHELLSRQDSTPPMSNYIYIYIYQSNYFPSAPVILSAVRYLEMIIKLSK